MIDDREIWGCANLLMALHGNDAWFAASQRADALFEQGDFDGQRVYVRILNRIKQLEAMAPVGVPH